ncbi:putative CDP-diacylglycerol--serine O-phosphatidyltransferase [Xanthomonas citri pv. citri]|nr:putative CDP-diacylglycerol--serine O-phosphatidyltransferase [Xanthomonas citri pv. citri]
MKRHFSMLRDFQLADWFTLANAFCGTGAVFAAMRFLQEGHRGDLLLGMALIPLAFVFDALDGHVARWRKASSTLGRELDSLADVVSFGVAPAALGYACGMRGGWDWLVLSYFVAISSAAGSAGWRATTSLPKRSLARPTRCRTSKARPFRPAWYW